MVTYKCHAVNIDCKPPGGPQYSLFNRTDTMLKQQMQLVKSPRKM